MLQLYEVLFHQPLLNLLVFLYETIAFRDLGIAIALLTVVVRLLLYPLFRKGMEYQLKMQALQPKLKAAQENHKGDHEKQTQAMLELYRAHKVNPFSGFGILIVQVPILIALYRIFLSGLTPEALKLLYSFVPHPEEVNNSFLGLIGLGDPNMIVVALAAVAQYVQGRQALRTPMGAAPKGDAQAVGRAMTFAAPVLTFVIFLGLPAAVALYWLVSSLFSIFQQYHLIRHLDHDSHRTLHPKPDSASGLS